jgi:large subunit ribosomal protein L15
MKLDSMKPPKGSRRDRKRLGRGPGSGLGKTSARGHKGQRSRTGGKSKVGFEGGQMPMARRLPKRGFKNLFKVTFQVVNVQDLNRFAAGSAVDLDLFRTSGLAHRRMPVKVLGQGKITHALTVRAHAFSESAAAAIRAAGGQIEVISTEAPAATENA